MSRRLYTNTCQICGKEFHPHHRNQPTCSPDCGIKLRSQTRRDRVKKTCIVCNRQYEVQRHRAETSKYCSKECWSNRNPPRQKTCPICNEKFSTYHDDQIYCSHHCAGKSKTGPDANAWKDGRSLHRERTRNGNKLEKWRKAVYERDDYTCQHCSTRGVPLHAHHIKSFSEYPDLRYSLPNGLTLCEACHGKAHDKDFSNRRVKECPYCGTETTGRGKNGLCRSCAITLWHYKQGHNVSLPKDETQALSQLASEG